MDTLKVRDLDNDMQEIRAFANGLLKKTKRDSVTFRVKYTRGDQDRFWKFSSTDEITVDREGRIL